jgi:citrate lyase beta subunit
MAIHPAQIESINEVFMPSKDTIAKARAIAAAVAAQPSGRHHLRGDWQR